MLQFKNETSFAGTCTIMPDADGIDAIVTMVKGTFVLDGARIEPADEQLPVQLADEYLGEPGSSSLAAASDLAFSKPATDVVLMGSAHAPGGRAVKSVDVMLSVGPIHKTIRVFGDRIWDAGIIGHRISEPQPYETMPLIWERAFGGHDETRHDPPVVHMEDRNPIGVGLRVKGSRAELAGTRLPNLEYPQHPICSCRDRPAPAGFGPICAHWEPRRSYAGTYDDRWQSKRAPFLPEDFDSRFFQIAPPDQVAVPPLRGGEAVEVRHATPNGLCHFALPAYDVAVTYNVDGQPQVDPAVLDTVVLDLDQSRVILVWRSMLSCDKKSLRVREISVSATRRRDMR